MYAQTLLLLLLGLLVPSAHSAGPLPEWIFSHDAQRIDGLAQQAARTESPASKIARARAANRQKIKEARKALAYRLALQRKEKAQRDAQRRKNKARLLLQAAINRHNLNKIKHARETAKRNYLAAVRAGNVAEAKKWKAAMAAAEARVPVKAPPASVVLAKAEESPEPTPEAVPEPTNAPREAPFVFSKAVLQAVEAEDPVIVD